MLSLHALRTDGAYTGGTRWNLAPVQYLGDVRLQPWIALREGEHCALG